MTYYENEEEPHSRQPQRGGNAVQLLSQILEVLQGIHGEMKVARIVAGIRTGQVATDAEIQGQHGDPKIRFDPKKWKGDPCKGLPASRCPPDFLDLYAETLDFFATHPSPEKADKAHYDADDAGRCRRWAQVARDKPPDTKESQRGTQQEGAAPKKAWGNGGGWKRDKT